MWGDTYGPMGLLRPAARPRAVKGWRRRLHSLRLWYLDLTVAILLQQRERVFADLIAVRQRRADLIKSGIQKGLTP